MSARSLEIQMARLEGAFSQVDHRLESFERMVASRFDQQDSRLGQIESRFSQIDSRFGHIDSRFGQIDSRFNQMEARFSIIDQRFNWVIGLLLTTWISTILTILFHR